MNEETNFTLIGQRIGMLVVESEVEPEISSNGKKSRQFKCVCDCGNSIIASYTGLLRGHTNNCGCTPGYKVPPLDLSGYRFGKLLVISEANPAYDTSGEKIRRWHCICDCGNKTIVRQRNLTCRNYTKSCGCLIRQLKGPNNSLVGRRYGMLTVKAVIQPYKDKNGNIKRLCLCLCDCGREHVIEEKRIKYGQTNSCGCLNHINLRNHKFGHLTILSSNKAYRSKRIYNCLCDCGKVITASFNDLYNSIITDCGCQAVPSVQGESSHLNEDVSAE